ncbi:MAG: hypothetical protein M5R40_17085 [Anaerolineae bacterium]|nr:hypothetical protein [Anaerolineae bacterium]
MESPAVISTAPSASAVTVPESAWRRLWRHNKGWLFVAPAVLLWLFVGFYTVAFSIILSFHRWNGFAQFSLFPTYVCQEPGCRFVGLKYYEELLTWGTPPTKPFSTRLGTTSLS